MSEAFKRRGSGATRERVLDTALSLFAERGLREPSLREIAREAGVSLGALQYHFPTREALHEGVMAHAMASFRGADRLEAIEDGDIEKLLRLGLRGNVAWARAHPRVQRLGTHLALEQPDHEWPGEAELSAEVERRILAAQAEGNLREFDPRLMMVLIEIVTDGWSAFRPHYSRSLRGTAPDQLDDRFLDFFVDVLLEGLRPR